MRHSTSSVVIVRALAAACGDAPALLRSLGLPAASVADVEVRLPTTLVARAWERAAEIARDRDFGLHLVERVPPGSFDVLEYVARSCPTWGEALRCLGRYYRILEDAIELRVVIDGDVARVEHRVVDPDVVAPRHGVEAAVAALVRQGRLAHRDLVLREVFFQHAAPDDVAAHRALFRAPLRFGAAHSGFTVARQLLDTPQPDADAGLREVLDRQAMAWLARLPAADDVVGRARRALAQMLPGPELGVDAVARALGMSRRSLQRALTADGTTFQRLLADVRLAVATGHLRDGRTVGEIAFLLGFSEPSAFQRAFRRWTGDSPRAFRARASS